MSKLIVIEGACDGIGKTTQYNLLKEKLILNNVKVISHHFPSYNTYHGAPVEKYLAGEFGKPTELSPYFINSLYAIDRAITWHTKLKKEYENSVILLDRYTTSSLIYQSAFIEDEEEKKKFIDYVIDFEYNKLGIKKPDIVIFLTAPFELVDQLRKKRKDNEGIVNDIYEKDSELMKKVYNNSIFVAKYLGWIIVDCSVNSKIKTIEEIHKDIYSVIEKIW